MFPDKKLRQRIEHAQIIHPDDIQRFARSGTIASMQAIHIPEDIDAANRYWGARARWAYPFRSLLQSGATIALGSDVPIETCNVFEGMTAALCRTRRTSDEVWYPEECMTREEIIYAYTVGAALASGEEHLKGTLSSGKLADFMVLSQDIFSVQPEKIAGTKVQTMVIGGNVVYES
ncbi:MAG TPA: amidohydrolase family protein, partial [bacterium]|nr:amidohydrolase family protein [bacterium]